MPESPQHVSRGEVGPWEEIALGVRGRLVSVAARILRNRADAEEVADESIARLAREMKERSGPEEIESWLCRTALNLAIDGARAWVRRRRQLEEISSDRRIASLGEEGGDPGASAIRSEAREEVWRRILQLPRRQQSVVILREMEGLPFAEVAKILEIRESTARAHCHAAREALRLKLRSWKRE